MNKYKLILDCIGKFHGLSFELDDVTVFYGPNEAGKTTVIDAMINCMILAHKKKHLYSKVLRPRYGDDVSTHLMNTETHQDVERIEHDLVKNLLVVRASTLDLEFRSARTEASWLEEVRNKLFAGGVNPQELIDAINEMERMTKTSGSPLYDVKKLDEQILETQMELESKMRQLKNYQSSVQKQEKLKADDVRVEQELSKVSAELIQKKDLLSQSARGAEKVTIHDLHQKISEAEKLKAKIGQADNYSQDGLREIRKLEEELMQLKTQHETYKEEWRSKQSDLEMLATTIAQEKEKVEKLREHHELARRTQNELESKVSETETAARPQTGLLIAGIVLLLIGIAIPFFLSGNMKYIGVAVALTGIGIIVTTFRNHTKKKESGFDFKKEIRLFNQQYRESPACPDVSYAAATEFLRNIIDSYSDACAGLEKLIERKSTLEKHTTGFQQSINKFSENEEEKKKRLISLLPHGVQGVEDYSRILQEKLDNILLLNGIDQFLDDSVIRQGVSSKDELVTQVEHKIIEFNNSNDSGPAMSQKEIHSLERLVSDLQKNKDELKSTRAEIGHQLTQINTEIQIRVGGLTREIVALEKRIFRLKADKDSKILDMDALRYLKLLVQDSARDTSGKFAALGEDINKYLRIILGDERKIVFQNLESLESVTCVDCSGQERDVLQLSTGTQDAFVLAARLALLEKVNIPKHSFLILDDPFIHLDPARMERAIQAIKVFHDEHEMPVMFFTKDEATKEIFSRVFESPKLIELSLIDAKKEESRLRRVG